MSVSQRKRISFASRVSYFLERPEKLFCILAISAGSIMLFLLPLFRAPDEMAHFARAYQVSEGQLFSQTKDGHTGGVVPQLEGYNFYNKLTSQTYRFFDFSSSAVYSPVSYIPQAIGITIGKIVYPSVAVMVYAGRLVNLIAYVAMLYIAIKTAKRGKWVYVVVGLIPMAIQQAASLSADVMTLGPIFIFIALVQNLFTQTTLLTKKQTIALVIIAIILGLTKQTNAILLLALFFIPKRIFASIWQKYRFLLLTFGVGTLALVSWYIATRLLHYNFEYAPAGVSQTGQIAFILHHPLQAVSAFFVTFFGGQSLSSPADFLSISMIGYFSWFDYKLPLSLIILSYTLLLVVLLYRERDETKDSPRLIWSQAIVFGASIVAVACALYISWSPVGLKYISGLQGRYFLAYIPLLIPLFAWLGRFVKISFDKPHRIGMLVASVSSINLFVMLLLTYKWFN